MSPGPGGRSSGRRVRSCRWLRACGRPGPPGRSARAWPHGGGVGVGRGHESFEHPQVVALLRVPLDTDGEPVTRQFEGLDDLVIGPGRGDQAVTGLVDGLVVQGLHEGLGAEQLAQRAVGAERDRVLAHLGRIGRVPAVADRIRQVLDQRAAPGHVEHVQAAADGQDRHTRLDRRAHQSQLEAVPAAVGDVGLLVRLGLVQGRVDVRSPGQHQPVEPRDQPGHAVRRNRRQDDGRATRAFYRAGVGQRREHGLTDPVAPVRSLELTGDPNERAGHAKPSCGVGRECPTGGLSVPCPSWSIGGGRGQRLAKVHPEASWAVRPGPARGQTSGRGGKLASRP